MSRNLTRLLIAALLVILVPTAVPTPAGATRPPSRCPAMTDSITRLYLAYFDREPDKPGFDFWVGEYSSGRMSLEEISQSLVDSPEFTDLGLISNQTYTRWLYQQISDREPTSDELEHWTRALDGGYPRGAMTLALTETLDYVTRTNTYVPLSGFLRWYPKGTHWYCNTGQNRVPVAPLIGDVWADYYFYNRSSAGTSVALWTLDANRSAEVRMVARDLTAGYTDYNWDGVFSGDGDYGRFIDIQAGDQTDWIVVFYPRSIGEDRLGWQLS